MLTLIVPLGKVYARYSIFVPFTTTRPQKFPETEALASACCNCVRIAISTARCESPVPARWRAPCPKTIPIVAVAALRPSMAAPILKRILVTIPPIAGACLWSLDCVDTVLDIPSGFCWVTLRTASNLPSAAPEGSLELPCLSLLSGYNVLAHD